MVADAKPRAKPGLLATDHSKRGQRYVTVLEEEARRVTLLAPWEHAVLVLCDGTRTVPDIVALLADGVDGEPVTREGVLRCLVSFSRDGLIDSVHEAPTPAARPATLANIQQAYREWHKDPDRSGRLLSGLLSPPFFDDPPPFQPSLAPTVALPPNDEGPPPVAVGSTLVVGGEASHEDRLLRSVLNGDGPTGGALPADEDLTNVAELLAAGGRRAGERGRAHRG